MLCLRAGYTHEQAWDLTLREVVEVVDAAAWRRRQAEKVAHLTGMFVGLAFAGKIEAADAYFGEDDDGNKQEAVVLEPEQEELVWNLVLGPGMQVH